MTRATGRAGVDDMAAPANPGMRRTPASRSGMMDDPKTTTLAVANQKGGVAKTTSVASIGAALAELGQ